MWMMFSGDRQNQLMQLDAFAEAYDEFNTFPSNQLALIEPLRAMRMIHYTAWLDKRWQDQHFKSISLVCRHKILGTTNPVIQRADL